MSTNKVEGSLWHSLPEVVHDETEVHTGSQRFAQLMSLAPLGSSEGQTKRERRSQRYRLVGGYADGVVCELSEREGEVCIKVLVPRQELYTTLTQLTSWLNACLQEKGHSIVLEVEYVQQNDHGKNRDHPGDGGDGRSCHDDNASLDDKHSGRGTSPGEAPTG